jgi:ribosomal protein L37AE/L43A
MPNRQSRQRNEKGALVCDSCKVNPQPKWSANHTALSVVDQQEMRRREAEAIVSIVKVRKAKTSGLSVVAHDSGDNAVINHCPFCGSGGVIGRSDGTASCEFCHSAFTVQVQPSHPFMPQTVDGQPQQIPGMPGDVPEEIGGPTDPTVEETTDEVAADPLGGADATVPSNGPVRPGQPPSKQPPEGGQPKKPGGGNQPPWLKNKKSSKQAFRTAEGRTLDAEDYIARLALEHADERESVLDVVRIRNTAKQATKMVECPQCHGDGIINGDGLAFHTCGRCNGHGTIDSDNPENFETREPPHEAVRLS